MSRVFVAREEALDREVVVKVLPPDLAAGIKTERFKREILLSARLQHPHIVPILSAGAGDDLLFYTMPFVNGPSLSKRMHDGKALSLIDSVSILRDVADALSYAHSAGVIHRDIKPQNILLNGHHALVVDFGVAKAIKEATPDSALTATGLALGTPKYMAPEQALADPKVDARADIYALGVVAYELFAGESPFKGPSPQAVMAAHITTVPPPLGERRDIPHELAEIVMRCLEKEPASRWQSAESLCEALNDFASTLASARRTPASHLVGSVSSEKSSIESPAGYLPYRLNSRILAQLAFGAVFLVALFLAVYVRSTTNQSRTESLVVLPFSNQSGEELEYFADGMTDEVITSLVKVEGLEVTPPASSFAFKNSKTDPREVGRRLNAKHVLVGAVRRDGPQVRITARLVNVQRGNYVWSNSYDGTMSDVFNLERSISRDIASALQLRFAPRTGQRIDVGLPASVGAFELFLKGNAAAREFSQDGLKRAIQHYRSALAIDTGYARAYAGIANAYYLLADDFWEPRKTYPLVRENALHALRLDSTLADAYASLASYDVSFGWDWEKARINAERAISLNPSLSLGHTILAWYNVVIGDVNSAIREGEIASSLDPYSYPIGANVVSMLRAAGRFDLAQVETRRLMQADVGNPLVFRAWLSWDKMLSGDTSAARVQLDSALAVDSTCCRRTRAMYYALTGKPSEAKKMLDVFVSTKTANSLYYRADWIAEVLAALGDREGTFAALNKAYVDRSLGLPVFPRNPLIRRFSGDPRYARLVNRLSVPLTGAAERR